jgi:hypothetical protein
MEGPNQVTKSNEEESKINEARQERERELSEWRMEINSYINKPLDQWSDDEKSEFCSLCNRMLNNFHLSVGRALRDWEDDEDKIPLKKIYGWDEEYVAELIALGEGSEKGCNNSTAQFYSDMKKTLLDNNINLDFLREMVKQNRTYLEKDIDISNDKSGKYFNREERIYTEEGKLYQKESDEHYCKFYLTVLPAVFDMLDNGYVIDDLSR